MWQLGEHFVLVAYYVWHRRIDVYDSMMKASNHQEFFKVWRTSINIFFKCMTQTLTRLGNAIAKRFFGERLCGVSVKNAKCLQQTDGTKFKFTNALTIL